MRLLDPDLAAYHRDLYASARDAGELLDRCRAALLTAPSGSYISHSTAARLQGLWVPDSPQIDISVLPGRNRMLDQHFAVHRGHPEAHVRTLRRLRVSTPAQVVIEMSLRLWLPELVALVDSVLAGGHASRDDLDEMQRSRRPGMRRLRQALALAVDDSGSAQESRLRVLLRLAGIPASATQYVVLDPWTGAAYRLDLAYPEFRIAVEYDGSHHRLATQAAADTLRREALRRVGWIVVVVTAEELFNAPGDVLSRVALALNERSGGAPRLDSAWRDHFQEHASREWLVHPSSTVSGALAGSSPAQMPFGA